MVKIPGAVYLIVGIGVAVTAYYIPDLKFFFYVGLLFILIGWFKITAKYILGKEGKEDKGSLEDKAVARICRKCGSAIRRTDVFCPRCGNRLIY